MVRQRSNFFIELQNNLVYGDARRNRALADLAEHLGVGVVATGNVHYHVRERHRLQDVLVAIKNRTTLDASHRLRRENSEYYLKPPAEMAELFRRAYREAIANTLRIAERCEFDLTPRPGLPLPGLPGAGGRDAGVLSAQALLPRGGAALPAFTPEVSERLEEELALVEHHGLAGFFLIHREILQLADRWRRRSRAAPTTARPAAAAARPSARSSAT